MQSTLIATAIELAEAEIHAGRNVMILFPDGYWITECYRQHPPASCYVRCSNHHYSLKSVTIDTLILVAPGSSNWSVEGEMRAHERLAGSLEPQVINVGGKP